MNDKFLWLAVVGNVLSRHNVELMIVLGELFS